YTDRCRTARIGIQTVGQTGLRAGRAELPVQVPSPAERLASNGKTAIMSPAGVDGLEPNATGHKQRLRTAGQHTPGGEGGADVRAGRAEVARRVLPPAVCVTALG